MFKSTILPGMQTELTHTFELWTEPQTKPVTEKNDEPHQKPTKILKM